MQKEGILLSSGSIIDGSGTPARIEDVLICGDKIAEIGKIRPSHRWEMVNCTGLHVVPGFIDIHSHSDKEVIGHLPNKILQGVTTEIVGNCGFSLFPSHPNPEGLRYTGEIFDGEPEEGMATTEHYISALRNKGMRVNVAALTGHVALRIYVLKMQREPSAAQVQKMGGVLDECLFEGSVGFSTGLNCMPSSFAGTKELVSLCRYVRNHGGVYTSHLRDYKFKVMEALEEALLVARVADVPLQISHMQVVGKKNWGKLDSAVELIENGLREGLDVGMDAYPYLAGSCSLIQFLPDWCLSGGIAKLLERLDSAVTRRDIASETDDYMSNTWDDLIISEVRSPENQPLIGKSIAKIGERFGKRPQDAALDLLRQEDGNVYVISFNSNEENLRKVLTHPITSVITDGMVIEGASHPRTFGTYPKFLGEYVREKRWLSLEEAIRKATSLPASRFRLRNRGVLAVGNYADIAIFSASDIGTDADYSNPNCDPRGMHHVLVNGRFGVRDGRVTDQRLGACLLHSRNGTG